MGGQSLEPLGSFSLYIQKTAEAVNDHPDFYASVRGTHKRSHNIFSAFVGVKVKGRENNFLLCLLDYLKAIEKSICVVVYVGDPLASHLGAVKLSLTEVILKIF